MFNKGKIIKINIDYFLLIGIVLFILKLIHVIDWPWWIVLLPIIGCFSIGFLLIGLGYLYLYIIEKREK